MILSRIISYKSYHYIKNPHAWFYILPHLVKKDKCTLFLKASPLKKYNNIIHIYRVNDLISLVEPQQINKDII